VTAILFSSCALAGTWTTLEKPGATETNAYGIDGNNIVGNYVQDDVGHGFLYDGLTWTTLDAPGAIATYVQSISGNNIVGYYMDGAGHYAGFLYNGSTWTTLDALGAEWTFAYGVDGNNIVGRYMNTFPLNIYGFIYNGSTWETLDAPGALQSEAEGISGDKIFGYYQDSSGLCHGYIYNGKKWTTLDMPGEYGTFIQDGDGDNIVGWRDTDSEQGFIYDGLTWTILEMPGADKTWAYGISGNKIVGNYWVGFNFYGFVYAFDVNFGSFDMHKNIRRTLKDCDGNDVTFSLSGGGYGRIELRDCGFGQIELFETTDKSVLRISTRGGVRTEIDGIICNGPLKSISAKTAKFSGSVTIGQSSNPEAAVKIAFDRGEDLIINSQMPIKSLKAAEWSGGDINAPFIGSIATMGDKKRDIRGDLDIDVNVAGAIDSVKIAGELSGTWDCNTVKNIMAIEINDFNLALDQDLDPSGRTFALGKLTAKGYFYGSVILSVGNIGAITAGAMAESSCLAGASSASDLDEDNVLDLPDLLSTTFNGAMIKSIKIVGIKGEEYGMTNSNIAATHIVNAYVAYPSYYNSDIPFGFTAESGIDLLKIKDYYGIHSWKNAGQNSDIPTLTGDMKLRTD